MSFLIGTVTYPDLRSDEKIVRFTACSVEMGSQCETSILNLKGCCMGIVFFEPERTSVDRRTAAIGGSGLMWTGYVTDIHTLRKRLGTEGIVLDKETNDSQILLESYFRFGVESLQELNGLYSIVIWDDQKKRFSAVTDRYGFTKIYYWLRHDGIMFASTCKAITNHPKYQKAIDKEGIINFLGAGYCFGERTLFKDIKLIPQGCLLVYEDRKLTFKKYWDYSVNPCNGTLEEFTDKFFCHLKAAFENCVNGKKSVFIPLSGGLDSRTMAGISTYLGLETYTCTLGRKSSRDYRYGAKVGKRLHSWHTKLNIESDYISKYGASGIQLTDGQITCHPFFILRIFDYKKTQRTLNALISGIGGSELVGRMRHGNIIYNPKVSLIRQHIEQRFLRAFHDNELHEILSPTFHSSIGQNHTYLEGKIEDAYAEDMIDKIWVTLVSERVRRYNSSILLLALGYRWNVYAPFMDSEFVDFILTVPRNLTDDKQKLFHNTVIKYLPRLAVIPLDKTGRKIKQSWLKEGLRWRLERLKYIVPPNIRQKYSRLIYSLADYPFAQKIGIGDNRNWVVDCDNAVRTGSAPYFRELFSDRERMADLFNFDAVNKLFKAHMERRVNEYDKLCAVATIIEWRRQFGI